MQSFFGGAPNTNFNPSVENSEFIYEEAYHEQHYENVNECTYANEPVPDNVYQYEGSHENVYQNHAEQEPVCHL